MPSDATEPLPESRAGWWIIPAALLGAATWTALALLVARALT